MSLCPHCAKILKDNDQLREDLNYLLNNHPTEWYPLEVDRIRKSLKDYVEVVHKLRPLAVVKG